MKKNILYVVLISAMVTLISCDSPNKQSQVYLKSNQDSYIHKDNPTTNYSKLDHLVISNFNSNDKKVITRSLINFDFSKIPSNVTIDSAYLYLDSPYQESKKNSGNNELLLQRLVEKWSDSTVIWNNQPKTSTEDEIILPKSSSKFQDYSKIDVSELLRSMKSNQAFYGFMLKMKDEDNNYKVQWFASGNNKDEKLKPSLRVFYTEN